MSKACFNCSFNQTDCFRPHCVPADGFDRGILTVNRMMPGPSIQVCKGDTIVVNVLNRMHSDSTSIHWHGVHQRTTPHQHGVPMVTQCPIPAYTSFQYRFKADPPGTHYWHSHSGVQRVDGLFGALIVNDPNDVHADLYDYDLPEHVIQVMDWEHYLETDIYSAGHHSDGGTERHTILINGLASYTSHTNLETNEDHFVPKQVFHVKQRKRYRFRVISNGVRCPVKMSIDNHSLTVIASDGQPFEPFQVESVIVDQGERYDFILESNQEPASNYWIRMNGHSRCSRTEAHQTAILRYQGAADMFPTATDDYASGERIGVELNPINSNLAPEKIPLLYMNYSHPNEEDANNKWNQPDADSKHYVTFDTYTFDNPTYNIPELYSNLVVDRSDRVFTTLVNHIAFEFPPSPLLTQYNNIPQGLICDEQSVENQRCNETLCRCVNRIKIKLGDVAEIFLIDLGVLRNSLHPFHLHGYSFRLVGYDRINQEGVTLEEIKAMDARGEIPRKLHRAVKKDTVGVPDGGYALLRIHATNPGFWFLHCHINDHMQIGMGILLQVGELSEMQPKPRNFPQCGHWQMEGYDGEEEKKCPSSSLALRVNSFAVIVMWTVIATAVINQRNV